MAEYQISASHLKKLKKDELTDHIKLLYSYIGTLENEKDIILSESQDLFWNVSQLLKEYIDDYGTHTEGEVYTAIEKLKEQNEKLKKENEEPKIWKSIARRKTEALTHCFPSYNPTFQTCDDKEEIIRMIEEIKKENEELSARIELWEKKENTD